MQLLAEPRGGRRSALLAGAVIFAMLAFLGVAARARATETIYWDNDNAESAESISFANLDGSGGGSLNLSGATVQAAEGLAFDPVNGRIYTASHLSSQIVYANVDGSGAGVVNPNGAEVKNPVAVVVDPVTQVIYWSNLGEKISIGWAQLNGSAGGMLRTTGATTRFATRLAIDPAGGRIYWASPPVSAGSGAVFASANLDDSGATVLPLTGAPKPEDVAAIAVDPTGGRLYWADEVSGQVGWANLSGVGGGTVDAQGATVNEPFGMAFDPSTGRLYWGNYGVGKARPGAIGTVSLAGGGGSITPATAPVDGPQDPLILKSPIGTGAPQITQSVAALSCSQGSWSLDYPGSAVYSAPTSFAYQWLLNGHPIAGATASTYTATAAGSYACAVTGANVSGTATQASATAVTVTAAKLSLALKSKRVHAKAGKRATVRFAISNAGDLASAPVKVCAKLTKKAKEGLVAPKCATVKALAPGGLKVATLKLKTKSTADGAYKFTAKVKGKGVSAKGVTVTVKVRGA